MAATMTSPLADIRALIARGEYLAAFDAASSVAAIGSDDVELRYLRALALARSGATENGRAEAAEAMRLAEGARLDERLEEDLAALVARLEKDAAAPGNAPDYERAAMAYQAVAERLDRPYACVNAATLWMIAGRIERARGLAVRSIELVRASTESGSDPVDRYWQFATQAEASIVLGDYGRACELFDRAARADPENVGARASTRRQLRLIGRETGLDVSGFLAMLGQPAIVHYTGHMVGAHGATARLAPADVDRVTLDVDRIIESEGPGVYFGGLASGADLIIAESVLRHGGHLHVVLPFDVDEYIDVSVRPAGDNWVGRFWQCLDGATTVTKASDSSYLGDEVLFGYASRLAMGQAVNRGRQLEADVWQLAVWDGVDDDGIAGTASDVRTWSAAGGVTRVVPVPARRRSGGRTPSPGRRHVRSILFGDFSGFSRLRDEHLAAFTDLVMAPLAHALEPYDERIIVRNTWGDGLLLVLDDPVAGAQCALALQDALAEVDLVAAGLPVDMGLRLAAHAAPVLDVYDPVLRRDHVMGRELTRAARIEPRTPIGQVYATASFAALLALEQRCGVVPEYVGVITTAKDFETVPVYRLCRST